MRKYKKYIQIGSNVTDIMMLPCVRRCYKLGASVFTQLSNDHLPSKSDLEYILFDESVARTGDWLMLDVCGNWHCMSNEEYEKHKNDEI